MLKAAEKAAVVTEEELEAVVLKVLGATRRSIAQAFLLEYGLLGLVTAAIASAIGTLAAFLVLTEIMRADFVFLPEAVIVTALLATAITVGFGFVGTWRALGQKAAPLLRNDTRTVLMLCPFDIEQFAGFDGFATVARLQGAGLPLHTVELDGGDHAAYHQAVLDGIRDELLGPQCRQSLALGS